jgi:hypothetical protein
MCATCANQSLFSSAVATVDDAQDDLKREMSFYAASLNAVLWAQAECDKLNIPHKVLWRVLWRVTWLCDALLQRPDDFMAEMAKSDEHMQKVFFVAFQKPFVLSIVQYYLIDVSGSRQTFGREQGRCAAGGAQETTATKSFWQRGKSFSICALPANILSCCIHLVPRCSYDLQQLLSLNSVKSINAKRRFKPRSCRRKSKRRGTLSTVSPNGARTARAEGFKVI